jgi:hypothetical protein
LCEFPDEVEIIKPYPYCNFNGSITNSNGAYIKTACHVVAEMTPPLAYQFCKSKGMSLYTITTQDEINSLYEFVFNRVGGMGSILVNGVYINGTWRVSNQPAPNVSSVYTIPQPREHCLQVGGSNSVYGWDCQYERSFMCEFVNQPASASSGGELI